MLDIHCSFLEESAVSPTIMVNHLPETASEISCTNLSVITSTNSLHITRHRKLLGFFISHKESAGCRQGWWIQQPAPPLDCPSQTSQTNGLIAQVPVFLFLAGSSHFRPSSGSLKTLDIVCGCLKNTCCFTVTQSSTVLPKFVFHALWIRKAGLLSLDFWVLIQMELARKSYARAEMKFAAISPRRT